jgi:hypothetical protein
MIPLARNDEAEKHLLEKTAACERKRFVDGALAVVERETIRVEAIDGLEHRAVALATRRGD